MKRSTYCNDQLGKSEECQEEEKEQTANGFPSCPVCTHPSYFTIWDLRSELQGVSGCCQTVLNFEYFTLSVEPPRQESGEVVALRAVPNTYGLTSDGE